MDKDSFLTLVEFDTEKSLNLNSGIFLSLLKMKSLTFDNNNLLIVIGPSYLIHLFFSFKTKRFQNQPMKNQENCLSLI